MVRDAQHLALVVAAAYGLDWERFVRTPYASNGWIVDLMTSAFRRRGIELPENLPRFDGTYHRQDYGIAADG
jgi:hypothetical protein